MGCLTYGSLFTGIGGFDLGFDRAGMRNIWQVEIDKDCNRVLEKHWHETKRFRDITKIDIAELGKPDVICGGFPCQDLSVAGQRKGLAGKRSGLWREFHRIIKGITPRFIVIENVPGLFSSNEGRDFLTIIRGLAELGYCLAWTVLDSQYRGVAQRRDRVFIVGSLGNGSCAEILFESESVCGHSPPSRETGKRIAEDVAPSLKSGFSESGHGWSNGPRGDGSDAIVPQIARSLNAERDGYNDGSDQTYVPDIAWALQERDAKGSDSDTKEGHLIPVAPLSAKNHSGDQLSRESQLVVAAPITSSFAKHHGRTAGKNGIPQNLTLAIRTAQTSANGHGIAEEISHALDGASGQVVGSFKPNQGSKSRGIGYSEKVSPTLEGAEGGNNKPVAMIGASVRRLTPRECERLQGFPDDWTRWDANGKEISDSARYRMLGNAVTVPVAGWVGSQLVRFA